MISALIIGRAGSKGFPNKNHSLVLGRPLCAYPLMAANHSSLVDRVFVATDSAEITQIALSFSAEIISLPEYVANEESYSAFRYGFEAIITRRGMQEQLVLLFCNGATIRLGIIDEGIAILRNSSILDSAVTVSCYNMWSPLRAHRLTDENLLEPCFPYDSFAGASCDRDSQGDIWFPDCSAFIVRPRCFLGVGAPPFPWIGNKIAPLKQWGGLDVDFEWQVPQVEFWLRAHGFTEDKTPYDDPDPR